MPRVRAAIHRHAAEQVRLRALDLAPAHGLRTHAGHLREHAAHDGVGVHRSGTGIREQVSRTGAIAAERADGVRETAPLAQLLKEAAGHPAAENG